LPKADIRRNLNSNERNGDKTMNTQRKNGRFSFLLEEWVFQLALVVAVVSALVERGIAMSGGVIV
jgi:hypothetical protein